MNCETVRSLLEAFVDDEIDATAREAVTRHLDGCVPCHQEAQALLGLAADARETLGPIEPDRNLWPAIAHHIDNAQRFEKRRRAPSAWWLVAAALVGVAVGVALMQQRQTTTATATNDVAPSAPLALALTSWEQEALENRTALLASLDRQRDRLPAESIRAVEENLLLIDEAIHEIRTALEQDPDNSHLNFLLADAYQQEVQLLKRLDNV